MNENSIKVLLISPLPPPAGGIATWTKQYLTWTSKNCINTEIINIALTGKRAKKINDSIRLLDEYDRTKEIIKELKLKLLEFKPDIVHLNSSCSKFGIIRDYIISKIVRKKNIKLLVNYRCNIEDQVSTGLIQNFFLKKIANLANINLVLNINSKEYLYSRFTIESSIISNFIDEDFVLKNNKSINEKIEVISFVGHIQKAKGIIEIIDAAKKYPDIIFKLAGPISDEINKMKVSSNVQFMGQINKNEVKNLLDKSDAFIFPSYSEGFANAILEAMSMGLPIITTAVGANKEMIETSGGYIINVGDSDSLIKAIDDLKNPRIRYDMSIWNVNKVLHDYTTDKIMKKLIHIYINN